MSSIALVLEVCLLLGLADIERFWALPPATQIMWQAHVLNKLRNAYDGRRPSSSSASTLKGEPIPAHAVADAVAADKARLLAKRDRERAEAASEPLTEQAAAGRALDILSSAGAL